MEPESTKKIINLIFGEGIMVFLKKIFIIVLVLLTLNLYLPKIHFAQELQLYLKSETVRSPEIRSAPKPEIRSTPEEDIPDDIKASSLRVSPGIHYLRIMFSDNDKYGDDELIGPAIFFTKLFTNYTEIRLGAYFDQHIDFDVYSYGLEIQLLGGFNLIRNGMKGYVGIGYFGETWNINNRNNQDFHGVQYIMGIGYNWKKTAIDFSGQFRQSDEYRKFFNDKDIPALSINVLFSYRF